MLGCVEVPRVRSCRLAPSFSAADLHLLIPFVGLDSTGAVTRSMEQALAAVLEVQQVTVDPDERVIQLTVQPGQAPPDLLQAVISAHGWYPGLVERADAEPRSPLKRDRRRAA
jgi:hypothetical protein